MTDYSDITIGDRIRFDSHNGPYWWTVRDRDERYIVTDNARSRITSAVKAVTDTWDEPLDDVHDIPPIVNAVLAEWAAGRAETTAATTEDAVTEVARLIDSCIPDDVPGYRYRYAVKAAEAMAARNLLATARTVRVFPTYTIEYQQKIADELGVDREAVLRALGRAAPLLATARTRDDVSDAIEHSGIAIGTSDAERAADAVLALLTDQPTEAD